MKKIVLFSAIFATMSLAASAQIDRERKPHDSTGMRRPMMQGPEMFEGLDLTATQKEQLKKSNDEMKAKLDAIRDDQTLGNPAKRDKIKALRDEQRTKTDAILTPEQREKLKAKRDKMMKDRKQNPE